MVSERKLEAGSWKQEKADPVSSLQPPASFKRVQAPCPYFGICGGCALQDLSYADQLALKRQRLRSALAAVPGMPSDLELIGLEEPWRYRTRAELTFGEAGGRVTLGLHARHSFRRVVDLDDCLLLPQPVMPVLREMRALVEASGLPVYHPRTHQGCIRYAVVRYSHADQRMLLCLVTTAGLDEAAAAAVSGLMGRLMERHPVLCSAYWGRTDRLADVAVPQQLTRLFGSDYLEERIGWLRVKLAPLSFLQSSTIQAERLYRAVREAVAARRDQVAWDLYCGVGVAALYLSRAFGRVYGIDSEPHHLELARLNAAANDVENAQWIAGRAEEVLMDRRYWLKPAKPDAVIVDPPREGAHVQVLSAILAARPQRIAYLSCNPVSLVRDLRVLLEAFPRYRVATVRAFDMFPQTPHVETFVLLERQ
ncbi:MAG: 23S rRNA (uracil(1939)-C(5))-methyltransferase RlmD [Candidatus Omnitrophica bacterium]|nr:23S rRNA (uracil(1939)-C(5))-methyltransferase RlmD [Candidatus Omnitrophota bacterium]